MFVHVPHNPARLLHLCVIVRIKATTILLIVILVLLSLRMIYALIYDLHSEFLRRSNCFIDRKLLLFLFIISYSFSTLSCLPLLQCASLTTAVIAESLQELVLWASILMSYWMMNWTAVVKIGVLNLSLPWVQLIWASFNIVFITFFQAEGLALISLWKEQL